MRAKCFACCVSPVDLNLHRYMRDWQMVKLSPFKNKPADTPCIAPSSLVTATKLLTTPVLLRINKKIVAHVLQVSKSAVTSLHIIRWLYTPRQLKGCVCSTMRVLWLLDVWISSCVLTRSPDQIKNDHSGRTHRGEVLYSKNSTTVWVCVCFCWYNRLYMCMVAQYNAQHMNTWQTYNKLLSLRDMLTWKLPIKDWGLVCVCVCQLL